MRDDNTVRRNATEALQQEAMRRLSEDYVAALQQARRWGTTMRDLGEGLVDRPHRVFVMTPGNGSRSADSVSPSSELPTLSQIHELSEKIRRTRARLAELRSALGLRAE